MHFCETIRFTYRESNYSSATTLRPQLRHRNIAVPVPFIFPLLPSLHSFFIFFLLATLQNIISGVGTVTKARQTPPPEMALIYLSSRGITIVPPRFSLSFSSPGRPYEISSSNDAFSGNERFANIYRIDNENPAINKAISLFKHALLWVERQRRVEFIILLV